MAQIASERAILKIESKKKERWPRSFYFLRCEVPMGRHARQADPAEELLQLRRKITELVARNSVHMVQQAIDAVREEGQYQAMKYLFEMVGLYPAMALEDSEAQDSLAQLLLDQLGLPPVPANTDIPTSRQRHPVK